MGLCGGGGSAAGEARLEQEKREKEIRQAQGAIDERFAGFDDAFYQNRAGAYEKFAMPQLAEQYQKEKADLTFELARRGLLKSSAAGTLGGELDLMRTRQQRGIADEGLNQANQLRQRVEQQRQNLYGLAATGLEPSRASSAAFEAAGSISAPSGFAPVGQFFGDFANIYLANKVADAYRQSNQNRNQPPLTFGNSNNSVRYYR